MYSDIERERQTADRLRKLPVESQLPYDWLEFRRRAQIRAGARPAHAGNGLPYAAVAAALLVLLVGVALFNRAHRPDVAAPNAPATESPGPNADRGADMNMEARRRVAERWLASLPAEPVIVRFGTRVAVTNLEDRIAQVDDLLTAANFQDVQPAHVAALQQERGRLVNSLAQVRYAEVLAADAP